MTDTSGGGAGSFMRQMSTIRHRQSRVGSAVGESTASTAYSPHALLPSASIRRPSQVHRFHGEIEFTGLNQTARASKNDSVFTTRFMPNFPQLQFTSRGIRKLNYFKKSIITDNNRTLI